MSNQPVYQLTGQSLVRQSEVYQTNGGAVFVNGKAIVIDPGVYKRDLSEFAMLLQPHVVVAGLITHAHWDHILWDSSLGTGPRYCSIGTDFQMKIDETALSSALDQLESQPGNQNGVWDRSRFFAREALVPGEYDLHGFHFELIELPGHCTGQAGFIFSQQGIAFVGDNLSDIEVPTVPHREAIAEYLATLDNLEMKIADLNWIVPGHGTPANLQEALTRLSADRKYLQKLSTHIGLPKTATDPMPARIFLEELQEHRATAGDGWGMHVENLFNIYQE